MPPTRNLAPRIRDQEPLTLAELRSHLGVTQAELGRQLGVTQPAVLKTERAADPQYSTLQRYIEALGAQTGIPAELRLEAVIGSDRYPIRFSEAEPSTSAAMTPRPTWRVRAWDDPLLEHEFLDRQLIAVGDDSIGDLTDWPGDHEVTARLRSAHPDRSTQAIGTFLRYWRDFRLEMQPGDVVVVPMSSRRAAIGTVGAYSHEPADPDVKLHHRRRVEWLGVVRRDDLDDDLRKVVNAPGTICRISAPDAAARLETIAADPLRRVR